MGLPLLTWELQHAAAGQTCGHLGRAGAPAGGAEGAVRSWPACEDFISKPHSPSDKDS